MPLDILLESPAAKGPSFIEILLSFVLIVTILSIDQAETPQQTFVLVLVIVSLVVILLAL